MRSASGSTQSNPVSLFVRPSESVYTPIRKIQSRQKTIVETSVSEKPQVAVVECRARNQGSQKKNPENKQSGSTRTYSIPYLGRRK
jgi:hypothetical protein